MHATCIPTKALQQVLGAAAAIDSTVLCLCPGHCVILYMYIAQHNSIVSTQDHPRPVLNVRTRIDPMQVLTQL